MQQQRSWWTGALAVCMAGVARLFRLTWYPSPQAVRKLLASEFPDLRRVETSSLHRGVAGARHSFLPAPPNANKLDVLAQVQCALMSASVCSIESGLVEKTEMLLLAGASARLP